MAAVTGNMDRRLTDDESRIAGKMMAAFMREMGSQPRELTVYTLAAIINAMAHNSVEDELKIIDELRDLSASPMRAVVRG